MRQILITLLCSAAALAAPESAHPDCAAVGDKLLILGSDFAEEPVVEVGGVEAEVIKSKDDKILVRVPDTAGLGLGDVTVDGETITDAVTILEEGAPTVLRQSAGTATVGLHLLLVGRRLDGGEAEFLDAGGEVAGTATLKGRHLAAFLTVPELDPGEYTVRITNEDGLDTGDCSPTLEIVEAGDPTLDSIEPGEAQPGDRIDLVGTDLGPGGLVRVVWTLGEETKKRFGFSNGYDRVYTHVPFDAEAGETYDVSVEFHDESTTGTVAYAVGAAPPPVLDALSEAIVPAGSTLRITGSDLFSFSEKPTVCLTDGGTVVEATVLFGLPGFGFFDESLLVRIPADTEDGDYDVTVKLGEETSNALALTVGPRPLAVETMKPDSQGESGRRDPVFFSGSGFGGKDGPDLSVVWDDGVEQFEGKVLFRSDQFLAVRAPGGKQDPLPVGTYDVSVILDPGGPNEESADAGTYTVD